MYQHTPCCGPLNGSRTSPPISAREKGENDENKHRVVTRGRKPDLQLLVAGREQPLRALAHELFDDVAPFASMLDGAYGGASYVLALQALRLRIDQSELTPSARAIESIREQVRGDETDATHAQPFADFVSVYHTSPTKRLDSNPLNRNHSSASTHSSVGVIWRLDWIVALTAHQRQWRAPINRNIVKRIKQDLGGPGQAPGWPAQK